MLGSISKWWFRSLLLLSSFSALGQRTYPTSTFKMIRSDQYFRIQFENDFFAGRDYYYTQGIAIEYANPALSKFFLYHLLLKPGKDSFQTGVIVNSFGFTPRHIKPSEIQFGDRPFAGCFTVKVFRFDINSVKKQSLSSAISFGVIGPAALGRELQKLIHKITGNVDPEGWRNQIRNDIILDYQVNAEKQLFTVPDKFLLNVAGEGRIGTLNDHLSAGLNFMIGSLKNPYEGFGKEQKRYSWYFFGQARAALIGYDATLEGGLFNRNSPYMFYSSDIKRTTFQVDAGIVFNFGKINLSFSESFLSREFDGALRHQWGNLSLAISH
jgi:lipid A 3-O-deacylase